MRQLGVVIREQNLPFDFSTLVELNGQLIASEAYAIHRKYIEDEQLAIGPHVRARIVAGKQVSQYDYDKAREHQRCSIAQFVDWMGDADVLLMPAMSMTAIPVDQVDEDVTPATFTRPGNYLGTCAAALPAGFSAEGLPVAIQLLAKPFAEQVLLRLGAAFERETGWNRCTPSLEALLG